VALKVAGLMANGTRIDTAEAVDVTYSGFFQLGARVSIE